MDILATMRILIEQGAPRSEAWKEIKKYKVISPKMQDVINRQLDNEEHYRKVT